MIKREIMKYTKIVCTIGPASSSYQTLHEMYMAGMNVARVNFSHGKYEEHKAIIDNVKKLRQDLEKPLAIMLDTKGPELRIGTFKEGKINLKQGQKFTFTIRQVQGDETVVGVSYPLLHRFVSAGNTFLVNDGVLQFTVLEVKDQDIICKCETEGELSDRKSLHVPGVEIQLPFLSKADEQDLLFGIKHDVDYVAASFVSTAKNVLELKNFLVDNGGKDIHIIAKIENQQGIDNLEEILQVADGIMVARGDLGVEIDYYKIPKVQKDMINAAKKVGKDVIVATEMLNSMTYNNKPTRAEISDVANAIYDEAGAVMLSSESATGINPVKAVQTMNNIIRYIESDIKYQKRFKTKTINEKSTTDTIAHSSCSVAMQLQAKAILVSTESGKTSRMVSKFRPSVPIFAIVLNEKTYQQLSLSWGVYPLVKANTVDIEEIINIGNDELKKELKAQKDDLFVITAGLPIGKKGSTNLLLVEKVK